MSDQNHAPPTRTFVRGSPLVVFPVVADGVLIGDVVPRAVVSRVVVSRSACRPTLCAVLGPDSCVGRGVVLSCAVLSRADGSWAAAPVSCAVLSCAPVSCAPVSDAPASRAVESCAPASCAAESDAAGSDALAVCAVESDALASCTPGGGRVGVVAGRGKTLDRLEAHGHEGVVERSVVALSYDRSSREVDAARIVQYFESRCRAVVEIPYDQHLAIGGRITLPALAPDTVAAFRRLAALVADEFC